MRVLLLLFILIPSCIYSQHYFTLFLSENEVVNRSSLRKLGIEKAHINLYNIDDVQIPGFEEILSFNNEGQIINRTQKIFKGQLVALYSYDNFGRKTFERSNNGSRDYLIRYSYNRKGNLTEQIQTEENGKIISITKFRYRKNLLVEKSLYNSNKIILTKWKFKYDKSNYLTAEIRHLSSENGFDTCYYKFGENKKLSEFVDFQGLLHKYLYFPDGRIKTQKLYEKKSMIKSIEYIYKENGLLTEIIEKNNGEIKRKKYSYE